MSTINERCAQAIVDGANWLAHTARVVSPADQFDDPRAYPHQNYDGAVRTEYDTKTRRWEINGPVWHTGQAIRSLLIAHRRTGDASLLEASRAMSGFVLRNIVDTPGEPNHGLLLSYEGDNFTVNNQVLFETLAGLLDLAEIDNDQSLLDAARLVADFVLDRCYLPEEGLIVDHYHVAESRPYRDPDNPLPGRIMLDDAVLPQLARATGNPHYTDVFLAMAERALREENPAGNWIVFPPWHQRTGRIHIRAAWWWGYPMLSAYDLTGDDRFWQAALRVGDWFLANQTLDGGFYYSPLTDGRHTAFGLASSGSAVASIIWHELYLRTGEPKYRDAIRRAVRFLLPTQFAQENDDPNIRGALWETMNVPDGSPCPGFLIRDISTIFMIRAFDKLLTSSDVLEGELASLDNTMPW